LSEQNFLKLRVLLLSHGKAGMPTLRTVLGIVGVTRIEAMDDPGLALARLSAEQFDAVFCSAGVMLGGRPFAAAARASKTAVNRMIPIFVVHDRASRGDVERARDTGATDVLTNPISAQTIIDKLGTAIARPKAFISAPNFFGPDRRAPREGFEGPERRVRKPRKVAIAVKADAPAR
jgi:two-component system, chemotaxis family, chemotaxis protein CheY